MGHFGALGARDVLGVKHGRTGEARTGEDRRGEDRRGQARRGQTKSPRREAGGRERGQGLSALHHFEGVETVHSFGNCGDWSLSKERGHF